MIKENQLRFKFGKNWQTYVKKHYDSEKVDISKAHMLKFMKMQDLKGFSFLDIGCGSGLHSGAALQAGAKQIHSFDYDINSVEATKCVKSKNNNPNNWTIEQGSVLDSAFMNSLPQYDIVYSWGVLHHTGSMWEAVHNAAKRVKPGGLFYIAIYSADMHKDPTPEFWLEVKQRYVKAGFFKRRLMELWYILRFQLNWDIRRNSLIYYARDLFIYLKRFIEYARQYKKSRGMSVFVDIRDWLGGWPMEFAYDADIIEACKKMGFKLKEISTGEANTEFLFVNKK